MQKFIIKSIIFLTLLILFLVIIFDPLFNNRENFFKNSIDEFYQISKDSIDIMIFGSSHSVNSYNPEIIDKTLNTTSFNFGSAAQKLNTTKYLIKEIVEEVKPKVVILDVFYFSFNNILDQKNKDFQFIVYNNTRNSLNKICTIYNYFGIYEIIPSLSPTIRNHNRWHELIYEKNINNQIKTIKGFIPLNNKISIEERSKYKDFYEKEYDNDSKKYNIQGISQSDINNIFEINNYLKDRNIELILVSAPYFNYFYSENNKKFHSLIKYLSDSLKINYLDFNENFNKLDLYFKDFNDQFHVNISGSNKLSAELAKYISEKSDLKISDETYFKKYLGSINPRTSDDIKKRIEREFNFNIIDFILKEGVHFKKEFDFINNLIIKESIFYSDDFNRYIALEYEKPIENKLFQKMQFGIHGVFYEEDYKLRPKWMQGTKDDRMTWKSDPEFITYNNKNYLVLTLKRQCEIDRFKKLRFFLKDKDLFREVIGKALEIEDIKF